MNKIMRHIVHQPFVMATGVAALVHSTWSLGTLFSGSQPAPDFTSFESAVHFLGWIVPAFLIAFALDVGQIATSSEIRSGHRNRRKYATFAVFAGATYYLQWLYMAHHMPLLELAPGVRETWAWTAQLIRDAAIWFIPALLPLSTLLYTFSHDEVATSESVHLPDVQSAPAPVPHVEIVQPLLEPVSEPALALESDNASEVIIETDGNQWVMAFCPDCGWTSQKTFETQEQAARSLRTHQQRYCEVPLKNLEQFVTEMHSNSGKR